MKADVAEIHDRASQTSAKIAVNLGFNCFSFEVPSEEGPREVLWSDPLFTEGTQRPSRSGIPILFPFPGRLRGSSQLIGGRTRTFDTCDDRGNAIHGFVYTRPWSVERIAENEVLGVFHASKHDPSLVDRWPGDFRISARYRVSNARLDCEYTIENLGAEAMPWGLGLHPYFRIAPDRAETTLVSMAMSQRWELAEMLPTGKLAAFAEAEAYRSGVPFSQVKFDDIFTGLERTGPDWTGRICDTISKLETRVSFGPEFPHCVAFTPPHREAICIEPYSCVSNAYELDAQGIATDLRTSVPGEATTMSMRIEVVPMPE